MEQQEFTNYHFALIALCQAKEAMERLHKLELSKGLDAICTCVVNAEHLLSKAQTICKEISSSDNTYSVARFREWMNEEEPNRFIRFGEIPADECSTEFKGSGDSQEPVKKLDGVSVYDCYIGNGKPQVIIPSTINKDTLDTLYGLMKYGNRPIYLVSGDKVGVGSDGEPLIRNVKIIEKIQSL